MDDSSGKWSLDVTFELWCQGTGACYVTGSGGQDDQKSGTFGAGMISVLLEGPRGVDVYDMSYILPITCVPVPEPEAYALAFSGLALVGGLARRRRKR